MFQVSAMVDGVVKSPIYFVVGFLKLHDILHVWSRNFKKHYASYIKLFPEPSENLKNTFYEFITYPSRFEVFTNLSWLTIC
jgi:hypothetical protein